MDKRRRQQRLTASQLVEILRKKIREHGDLEVSVNTQDGGSYSLYGEDSVNVVTRDYSDGSQVQTIEIG